MAGINQSNLSTKAYEQIKQMILHLTIKPGERIPEEKIAGYVGGSRTPVREAMRRLSSEGLVNIYPRRYAEVAQFSERDVKQIGTVRLSQDILASQLAIQRAREEDISRLLLLAQQCEAAAESGKIYDRIVCDASFHLEIYNIGGNQLLIQSANNTYQLVHLIQAIKYDGIQASMQQIRHHRDIIEGLRTRDVNRAVQANCLHLQEFYALDQEIINFYR